MRALRTPHRSPAPAWVQWLYTVTRVGAPTTTPIDGFAYTVIDPTTGTVVYSEEMPGTLIQDTLQMSPLIGAHGELIQGIVRIARR